MKDHGCGSIPRPQRPAFCIFMQLFIVDLSFEKSSRYFSIVVGPYYKEIAESVGMSYMWYRRDGNQNPFHSRALMKIA